MWYETYHWDNYVICTMPPEMAVSMRRTKMKAEGGWALIAGEITKPSWESRNEGIHERVSFEDTIWGFDLAGGSYYKTPLRVTFVKPGSRAERAGIRPGDRLLRINGVDTSTLTIQEAHDIIVKAGLYLHLNVTSPDDRSDAYYCYEDPIIDEYEAEQERLRAEAARRRQVHAKV
ncbi:PDZ and LIM domain protein 4-like, partial [Manduca sexta]|uniref:PDZ and LIM domain protein 4-like n=1 Tax=Manduca sexta TaxID=7130 RepID=UPI00188EEB0A